ncbi:MAG: GTP pyrophosphokinase [Arenicella sp.]
MTTELEIAQLLAIEAHEGQFRKDGSPYTCHLELVASKVTGEDAKVVAWLHDVLEDTDIQINDLKSRGISQRNIEIIKVLTKKREQRFEDYIDLIMRNELARTVKVADLIANLSDNPSNKQIIKFSKALIRLCGKGS